MSAVSGQPQYDERGRVCRGCQLWQPWNEYTKNAVGFMGKASRCVSCERPKQRERQRTKAGREARRRAQALYRQRHPDRVRSQIQAWHAMHPEYEANRVRNPVWQRQAKKRRRARLKGAAIGQFTQADWDALLVRFDYRCAYCFGAFEQLEQDHVVPLTRGGAHDRANIVPACRSCNASKATKLVSEWLGESRWLV